MPALDLATLGLKLDADGLVSGSGRAKDALRAVTKQTTTTEKSVNRLQRTVVGLAAAFSAYKTAQWARDTIKLGARYETLGVVMGVVGRNVGKTRAEMDALQASLQKTGISMIQARQNLARMVGAQIDLKNATQLARLAQDAAVIADLNSSDAFERLIAGISRGRPILLRTMGIFVDFNLALQQHAKATDRTVQQLSEVEKTQVRANATLRAGRNIVGAYTSALGTASKQMRSAERFLEDMRVKVSLAFQPAYTEAVFAYASALKFLGRNADTIAAAIIALTTVLASAAAAMVIYKIGVLAVAAANSFMAATLVALGISLAALAAPALIILGLAAAFTVVAVAIVRVRRENRLLAQEAEDDARLFRANTFRALRLRRGREVAEQAFPEFAPRAGSPVAVAREAAAGSIADLKRQVALQQSLNDAFGQTDFQLERIRIAYEFQEQLAEAREEFQGKELVAVKAQLVELLKVRLATVALTEIEERRATAVAGLNAAKERQIEQERQAFREDAQARKASKDRIGDLETELDILERQRVANEQGAAAVEALRIQLAGEAAARQLIRDNPLATTEEIARVRELVEAMERLPTATKDWATQLERAVRIIDQVRGSLALAQQIFRSGDPAGGALTGALAGTAIAPGIGTVIGAGAGLITGLAGSIFNAGKAAEEARRRFAALNESLRQLDIQTFGTDLEQAIDAIRREAAALRAELFATVGGEFTADTELLGLFKVPEKFLAALREINALEAVRIEQLLEQARLREQELRDDLRVRALRARGSSMEADALRFQLEQLREIEQAQRDNVDSATMVLLVQTLWAEKMARITALMLQRAEMLEDLQVRLLRARGLDDEADALAFALAQQREYAQAVRDGVDAVTLATLAEVQRVEAIRFATEMELRAADERVRAAQETVDATRRTVESLRDYSRSLGLTLATPGQSVISARQEFERVAALARAGDQAAAAKLPELGRILLEASRAFNASGRGFVQDLRFVQSIIDELANQFDAQATIEQQALDAALEQQRLLQAILDALRGEEDDEERRRDRDDDWEDRRRRERDEDNLNRRRRQLEDREVAQQRSDEEKEATAAGFTEVVKVLRQEQRETTAAVEDLSRQLEGLKIA